VAYWFFTTKEAAVAAWGGTIRTSLFLLVLVLANGCGGSQQGVVDSHEAATEEQAVEATSSESPAGFPAISASCDQPVAPDGAPATALRTLFATTEGCAEWYAPFFLQLGFPGQFQVMRTGLEEQYGPFTQVVEDEGGLFIAFERGRVPATVQLDDGGLIMGLWFQQPGGDNNAQSGGAPDGGAQ
jgi:hypothetical protein